MTLKEEASDAGVAAMRDVSNISLEKNESSEKIDKEVSLEPEVMLKTAVDDDVVRAVEAAETVIMTNVDELLSQTNEDTRSDASESEYDDMSIMTDMTSVGGGEELEALQRELEGANFQTFLRDKNTKRIKGLDRAPGMGKSRPARRRRLLRALRAEGKIPPKSNNSNQSLEQISEEGPSSNSSSSLQKALQQKQPQEKSPKPNNQRRPKENYSNARDNDDTTKHRTPKSNHRRGPKKNYEKINHHKHHNRYSQPYNNMPTGVSLHSPPPHHQAHYYNTASPTAPTHHYHPHPPYLQNYYPPNTHHMTPLHNQHHSHNHPQPYSPTPYTSYPNSSPYQNHSSHDKPSSKDNTFSARNHNHNNSTQPHPADKVSS